MTALRLAAALVTVVTATGLAAPAPAVAAAPSIRAVVPDLPVTDDGAEYRLETYVETTDAGAVQLTYDLSGLAGVARVDPPEPCEPSGTTLTCWMYHSSFALRIPVRAEPGARVGDEGVLRWTARVDGAPEVTGSTTIGVVDQFDLAAGPLGDVPAGEPGELAAMPVSVRNLAGGTAHGVRLFVFGEPYYDRVRYRNCWYADRHVMAYCDLDVTLAPGEGFELVDGFGLVPRDNAIAPDIGYRVAPAGTTPEDPFHRYTRGDGPELRTRPLAAPRLADGVDPARGNSQANGRLLVHNRIDLAVTGARAGGAVGETVEVTMTARNRGPGALESFVGEHLGGFDFAVPKGTQVVRVPHGCFPVNGSEEIIGPPAGHPNYHCSSLKTRFAAGASVTYTFGLRLERAGETVGTVQAVPTPGATNLSYDPDRTNNTARVTISVAPADGTGGGLPITGARSGPLAGLGVGLLGSGLLLFLAARRRRPAAPPGPGARPTGSPAG